jgi:hypothetical protein
VDVPRRTVASLIYSKIVGTRGFVTGTGARGFLHLSSKRSRIGQGLATVGPVTGGLRFSTADRLVVIERCDAGYRVLVRAFVGGMPLVFYDELHADVNNIPRALLRVLDTKHS